MTITEEQETVYMTTTASFAPVTEALTSPTETDITAPTETDTTAPLAPVTEALVAPTETDITAPTETDITAPTETDTTLLPLQPLVEISLEILQESQELDAVISKIRQDLHCFLACV
jgi:hypothetical protein